MNKSGRANSGKPRWVCRNLGEDRSYCYITTDPNPNSVRDQGGRSVAKRAAPIKFTRKLTGKRFVITSAQNATPIHKGFFEALKAYCKHIDAELVVIPIRYKNPTSRWSRSQAGAEWWVDEVQPYLYNQRKKLGPHLVLLGDIKVVPTAQRPLSGFEGITHAESGIIGHPKLQLATIATPQYALPKIMTTTGSVTLKNYTDSKAGAKGAFHHVFGAAVVEIHGSKFHLRQINALNDGSFIDLDYEYLPDGTHRKAAPALGLVMGDTHVRFIDPKVDKATFGPGGMVERLNPKALVWHDLLDNYAGNPHHLGDPFISIAKYKSSYHVVKDEIEEAIEFLRQRSKGRRGYVVASNHNDFFRRWVNQTDWRRDPANAEFYLKTAAVMAESAKMIENGADYIDPFTYWIKQRVDDTDDIVCLEPDESCLIGGNECSFHGDNGPNGARGTVINLSKIGVRVVSGHGHAPAIEAGHYRTGTSTYLKLEYTTGPSSWLNTHCVIYANGKRSLLNIIGGEWCHDSRRS